MAEDIMASFSQELDSPSADIQESVLPQEVATAPPAEDLFESFQEEIGEPQSNAEIATDVESGFGLTPQEVETQTLDEEAKRLNVSRDKFKTGTPEFIAALKQADDRIAKPTFFGALKEGLARGSAGEVVGEGVATGLVRDFVVPGLIKDKQDLAQRLIAKNPDKKELIMGELANDSIDVASPDTWALVGDSAEAAMDLVFLGRGKAMTKGVKTVLKQVAKQVEKEAGTTAAKKFVTLLRTNLFESGKQLTKFKNIVGQPLIGGTQATAASLARDEDGGDAILDGVKAALFTAGLQAALGPVARIVGKNATGTNLEKFLSPKLTPKLARIEATEGLLVTTKGKSPKIKLRLPSNRVKEMTPVIKKRLPGLENQDVGTAISDIDSEITRSSKAMAPRLKKVKTPIQTKQRSINAMDDAEQEIIDSAEFPDEKNAFIKKQFNFARKQIEDAKIKNVQDFQDLRKAIDKKTPQAVKDYNPTTGSNIDMELKQIIWKSKRDLLNEESIRIADGMNDTGLGTELSELSQLYRASDNLQTHITQLEVLTLGDKLKNIPTLFVGGAAGSAGAKVLPR